MSKQIAKYLRDLITGRGLSIPAVHAEMHIEAKQWLAAIIEGQLSVTETKEVRLPHRQDGGVSSVAAGLIPSNGGAPLES